MGLTKGSSWVFVWRNQKCGAISSERAGQKHTFLALVQKSSIETTNQDAANQWLHFSPMDQNKSMIHMKE